ncbi:MAG: DUF1549 and DUF1553 domain-containing protein [Bacteroidales bacterium]|nr:DUF1549 and DUF1553 domain-containing protein [Bacteroidales bacterium]
MRVSVPVTVSTLIINLILLTPASAEEVVSFRNHVSAILSRSGCNAGSCHGNLTGKGGLKLSIRGEDAAFDYAALTREMLGRRVNVLHPAVSLLLHKATGELPHGGGIRFDRGSHEYRVLRAWIAQGCRYDANTQPPTRLTVTPTRAVLFAPQDRVSIRAVATFPDGSQRDVTNLATFETTAVGIVQVQPTGEAIREREGEVVVLVRYLNQQVPVSLAFLPDRPAARLESFAPHSELDRLNADLWRELRIEPSAPVSDAVFMRRAYLDACGILPTAPEVRQFLADTDPAKREKLVDSLLIRPEFADYWAQKWSDILRNEEKSLDRKGVQIFYRWIRNWLAEDRPLHDFAREVLTARGSTYQNPPANFYRAIRDPYQRAESVAQVFLGLRISCARCHNHPFDVWTQDDYHQFAALFNRIDYRVLANNRRDALDKHEFVGEQIVLARPSGELPLPRGGKAVPAFLGSTTPNLSGRADRLAAVADWVADPNNPFFARTQANRIWFHLFGQGIVEPNDDFKIANPPSHPALLDHLAKQFAATGYRLRPLVRYIMTSQTYQRSSRINATNAADSTTHFSRAVVHPLEAEQLLDGLSAILAVPVQFPGYPTATRAGELPAPAQVGRRYAETPGSRFLRVFGKPERLLTCECERSEDPGMLQAFQMLTGELLNDMLRRPNNRIGRALEQGTPDTVLLEEFFLTTLTRYPHPAEREKLLQYLKSAPNRRAGWEDIVWGLLNSKEFLLRR